NRRLTRGQFIQANVLAQDLGATNPSITTEAILDGLKSGKSIGKTLQSLGLSAKDADKAQEAANSEIRRAGRGSSTAPKDSPKPKKGRPGAMQPGRRCDRAGPFLSIGAPGFEPGTFWSQSAPHARTLPRPTSNLPTPRSLTRSRRAPCATPNATSEQ